MADYSGILSALMGGAQTQDDPTQKMGGLFGAPTKKNLGILADALMTTWPVRAGQSALQGLMAPGNAYQSTPENPVTTEQMIGPATDLAGLVTGMPTTPYGALGAQYRAFHGMGAPMAGEKLIAGHPHRYDPGFMGADGIYSTNMPHLANDYATLKAAKEINPAPNVMPLNLEMNNPLTISAADKKRLSGLPQSDRDQWLRDVYARGHDGVIVDYGIGKEGGLRSAKYQEYLAPAEQYSSVFKR